MLIINARARYITKILGVLRGMFFKFLKRPFDIFNGNWRAIMPFGGSINPVSGRRIIVWIFIGLGNHWVSGTGFFDGFIHQIIVKNATLVVDPRNRGAANDKWIETIKRAP